MTPAAVSADRNVDGILSYMRQYLAAREQQVVRIKPELEGIIRDVVWLHLEILRKVLQRSKSFGGEKFRVADILTGADDTKRRALLSAGGEQNSIMDEIIDRTDDSSKAVDYSIHDMRTFFRSIDPSLENLVQLIQHWMKWDLPDAADLHGFDEEARRLTALRSIQLNDDVRSRYRQALGRPAETQLSDAEIFEFELRRLDVVAGRFCGRRQEEEPYQYIICRENCDDHTTQNVAAEVGHDAEPYNYKLRQCDDLGLRVAAEHRAVEQHLGTAAV